MVDNFERLFEESRLAKELCMDDAAFRGKGPDELPDDRPEFFQLPLVRLGTTLHPPPLEGVIVCPDILEEEILPVGALKRILHLGPGFPHLRIGEQPLVEGITVPLPSPGQVPHVVFVAAGAFLDERDVGKHGIVRLEVPPLAAAESVAAGKGDDGFLCLAVGTDEDGIFVGKH